MKPNDDMFVIVKAGSASGVVVLLGQQMAEGESWFTLVVVDHPVEPESAQDLERVARQAPRWVGSVGEAFQFLNQYPWLQLYPREVHPLFVEEVRYAVADRLAQLPRGPQRDRQWQEWQRVLREAGGASG